MRKQPTPEQKEKADARRAAMRQLAANISKMSETQRAELAARVPIVTIEGRHLSPFNSCMVAMQNPTATVVGGFRQWLKAGRAVRKGEKGLAIWVPAGNRQESQEAPTQEETSAEPGTSCRFVGGTVFDVAQTEEKEAQ